MSRKDCNAPAATVPAVWSGGRNISVSVRSLSRRYRIRILRATVIACSIIKKNSTAKAENPARRFRHAALCSLWLSWILSQADSRRCMPQQNGLSRRNNDPSVWPSQNANFTGTASFIIRKAVKTRWKFRIFTAFIGLFFRRILFFCYSITMPFCAATRCSTQ